MRKTLSVLAILLLTHSSGAAQPQQPPKPSPEQQKLSYFVGTWNMTGEMKASPFGPGGPTTATETCEWFSGGYAIVCRSEGKSPTGAMKGLAIMGYSSEEKTYVYYAIDNTPMIMANAPKGTFQGDTLTFSDESLMGGKKIKSRFVMKTAPASYAFKWEMEQGAGKWTTILDGTATKKK